MSVHRSRIGTLALLGALQLIPVPANLLAFHGATWVSEGRAVAGEAVADSSLITLSLSGSPDARFSGECELVTRDGTKTFLLEGTGPERRQLSGEALQCRLAIKGRLTVEVRKGRSAISRSTTTNGVVQFSVR